MEGLEIFGVSGKIGTGKNYVAENILWPMLPEKNTVVLSFADHFKIDAIAKDKVRFEDVFHKKTEESRKALQKRGTEEGREVYGPMIWVDTLRAWMRVLHERGIQRVIIGDVRFKSEADAIKALGGYLIRVNAPQRNREKLEQEAKGNQDVMDQISSHVSEIELDDYAKVEVRNWVRYTELRSKKSLVIFCDLDNTICECNKYYREQVKKLLNELGKYRKDTISHEDFEYQFYKLFYEIDANYQQYSFTIDRFPESLKSIVEDMENSMVVSPKVYNQLLATALRLGYEVFDYKYEPLGNALDTVKKLSTEYTVVINTMGNYIEQKKKITELGLSYLDVHVTHNKCEDTFRMLMEKYKASQYVMIGDSLIRDIIPAIDAGVHFVYWIGGNQEKAALISNNIICVNDIEEVEDYILSELFI
jgi:FMN phosphatase YigB (HAD superfamily)